jgi:hypothetical protein
MTLLTPERRRMLEEIRDTNIDNGMWMARGDGTPTETAAARAQMVLACSVALLADTVIWAATTP